MWGFGPFAVSETFTDNFAALEPVIDSRRTSGRGVPQEQGWLVTRVLQ